MTKKKAIIYTIIFAVIAVGVCIASMFIELGKNNISLFEIFSPYIVGYWIGRKICEFYDWLTKND